jgi:hypothetical protein
MKDAYTNGECTDNTGAAAATNMTSHLMQTMYHIKCRRRKTPNTRFNFGLRASYKNALVLFQIFSALPELLVLTYTED